MKSGKGTKDLQCVKQNWITNPSRSQFDHIAFSLRSTFTNPAPPWHVSIRGPNLEAKTGRRNTALMGRSRQNSHQRELKPCADGFGLGNFEIKMRRCLEPLGKYMYISSFGVPHCSCAFQIKRLYNHCPHHCLAGVEPACGSGPAHQSPDPVMNV